jgi:hypothetical protein
MMLYCPYTNTSPPKCFNNEVVYVSENLKEMFRRALKDPGGRYCVSVFDQVSGANGICVKTRAVSESLDALTIEITYSLCGSECLSYSLIITVPKKSIE